MPLSPADVAQVENLIAEALAEARVKISELPATGAVSRSGVVPFVSGGATTKLSLTQLLAQGLTTVPVGQDLRAMDVATVIDDSLFYTEGVLSVGDGGEGFWRYDAASVATDDIGTVIAPDTGVGRFLRQYSGAVQLPWFGDATSDLTTLPAAVAAAQASPGKSLFIPNGSYVANPFSITSTVSILGSGVNTVITINGAADAIAVVAANNVTLENFALTGAAARMISASGSAQSGLYLRHLDISGAVVEPASLKCAGIYCDNYSNVVVDWCHVHDCGLGGNSNCAMVFNNGVTISLITNNIAVTNCRVVDNTDCAFGILIFNASNSRTIGNYINGVGLGDPTSSGYGICFYASNGATTPIKNNVVAFNTIVDTQGTGIYLNDAYYTAVTGNTLELNAQSQTNIVFPIGNIGVNECDGTTVTGNVCRDSGLRGIDVSSKNTAVTGNTITDPTTDGIYIRPACVGSSFCGNPISGAANGIVAPTTIEQIIVSSNICRTCSVSGINLVSATNCSITGNVAISCASGLLILGGDGNTVTGNRGEDGAAVGLGIRSTNTIVDGCKYTGYATGFQATVPSVITGLNQFYDNTTNEDFSGGAIIPTITSGVSPSVAGANSFLLTYAAPTNIQGFEDGLLGDIRTFRATNGNATMQNTSSLFLKGAGNFAMVDGDTLTVQKMGISGSVGIWWEVGRMDVTP